MLELIEYKNDGALCYSYMRWNTDTRQADEVRLDKPYPLGEIPALTQEEIANAHF